jgi:hypothetical protein
MSDTQFHETRMGRTFYEHTLPRLAEQLERLNKNLERVAERVVSPENTAPSAGSDVSRECDEHRE